MFGTVRYFIMAGKLDERIGVRDRSPDNEWVYCSVCREYIPESEKIIYIDFSSYNGEGTSAYYICLDDVFEFSKRFSNFDDHGAKPTASHMGHMGYKCFTDVTVYDSDNLHEYITEGLQCVFCEEKISDGDDIILFIQLNESSPEGACHRECCEDLANFVLDNLDMVEFYAANL